MAACTLALQPTDPDPYYIEGFLADNAINGGGECLYKPSRRSLKITPEGPSLDYWTYPCRVDGIPTCNCPTDSVCEVGCVSTPVQAAPGCHSDWSSAQLAEGSVERVVSGLV